MKKVLLDTNMMLAPVQFKADIYSAITADFYTLDNCMKELKKIAEKKTKSGAPSRTAVRARAAFILAKVKAVKTIKAGKKETDKALTEEAKKGEYIVATNDRELIKALKKLDIRVLRLKQKKLVIEE
ncbi:MAG: hypothetical protein HY514_01310 [Candidatus Aenigmarchaeota archaeon]|nr:hypothetical protein [Candidatus Aenigmarchaeota archaeon]